MIILKGIAFALVLALGILVLENARAGWELAMQSTAQPIPPDDDLLRHHKSMATAMLCVTGTAITLIELLAMMARSNPDRYVPSPWLYWSNIVSGAVFVSAFLLAYVRFNGERYPRLHAKLVYTGYAFLPITLATGLPMLWQL